jgi:Uma2 family endonuclease
MGHLWGTPVQTAGTLMTADDLLHSAYESGYELIEGRLVKMSPTGFAHGEIAQGFSFAIQAFVKPRKLGAVVAAETGFVVSQPGQPDTVLAPDVAFVRASRLPPRESPERRKFLHLAPDLVVEVASPGQSTTELAAKAQFWLQAGVRLVWVAWPETATVDDWRSGVSMTTLTDADALDGYDVLPGFAHRVGSLF